MRSTRLLQGLGILLLTTWAIWSISSYAAGRMLGASWTTVDALPTLAADFEVHNEHTARLWAQGRNPYRDPCDWVCDVFCYPPMVPRLFSWVGLVSTPVATATWLSALVAILGVATVVAVRTRRSLGLAPVPLPLALAVILYSTPVLFALERGQADALTLPFVLLAAWLLLRRSPAADASAGALLAVAAWVKYYPSLLGVGLLAMRRWPAVATFVVVAAAIGVHDAADVQTAIANAHQIGIDGPLETVHAAQHSIAGSWNAFWTKHRITRPLAKIPRALGVALLLLPLLVWVSFRLATRWDDRLMIPYFFWLLALGTFAMPYANDYNLFFLPLGLLAVWDRRDSTPIHALGALSILWWQPLRLPVSGELLLLGKLAGLVALGAMLVSKSSDLRVRVAGPPCYPAIK